MQEVSSPSSPLQWEDETKSPLVPDPTIPGRSSRHNPALDGLRGVAILGVLLFHGFHGLTWVHPLDAWLSGWFEAGWMGVDVFFVLSGFLITGILLDTRSSTAYFRSFYARRFLRIFPVYYLLLAIVFLVLPWFIPFATNGLRTIQHRQVWLWTYLTNMSIVFYRKAWAESNWLDLSHLWSLAVEEQFYLFWPLVVYFLSRRWLKVACLVCIALSFVLRAIFWHMGEHAGALYFPTPCRLDGLAMGALVAVLIRDPGGVAAIVTGCRVVGAIAAAALLGLCLLRGGLRFTDLPTLVFGVLAISLMTACVVGLIAEVGPARLPTAVLNNPFLRMSGKYSYGLYLFHNVLRTPFNLLMPAKRIAIAVGSELIGNLIFVALFIALSYAVALTSWHLFEKHWLKLKSRFDYQQ